MATVVRMPQQGLEVTEGIVTEILVEVGAKVAEGDPLCEVETEKALSDVVAPTAGFIGSIAVEKGDTVAVGAVIMVLVDSADEVGAPLAIDPNGDGQSHEAAVEGTMSTTADTREPVARTVQVDPGAIKAAPVARRAAEQLGVDLALITGTGPNGRITLADIEAFAEGDSAATTPAPKGRDPVETVEPLSPTRQAIARRMAASQQIPQYQLTRVVDATWLLAERERFRLAATARVNVNDLLVQALAEAVVRHPILAASFVEPSSGAPAGLRRKSGVAVGLAVATDRGLLVPVITDAHERSLDQIAEAREGLVDRARRGKLALEEMSGATISISNLGGFGIDHFTAMVNPGESAILAVGRTGERMTLHERGIIMVPTLDLTMSFDHRVIDGAAGAAALGELARLLEGDMRWRA